jgi:ABC-2 type transport system ATP-binding protein
MAINSTGTPALQPVVVTEELAHTYRSGFLGRTRIPALSNIHLTIGRGEVFGLLGPNGSGKTTFMKILLGLLRPSSGKLTVLDHPPGAPEGLSRIGYLAETPAFLPLLTGEETLHLAARVFRLERSRRNRVVEELLRKVGLVDDARRPVGEYSQGMQKRIALAQALVNDPELLLLDEPTAALDPASAENVQATVREAAEAGKTVILSSHLLSRVEEVASRVCILHEGKICRTGTLEEVAAIPGSFDLRVKGGPLENAVRILEDSGFSIVSSRPASLSLQDVFLKLTGGRPDDPPAANPTEEPPPDGGAKGVRQGRKRS